MITNYHKPILIKLLLFACVTFLLIFASISQADLAQGQGMTEASVGDYIPDSTITVNTFDDELNSDGDCSLREAVQAANTNSAIDACMPGSGDDTISLPPGIYTLSIGSNGEDNNLEGDLDITGVLTITGISADTTILQAGTDVNNGIDRVLHAMQNSHLTVENVTIRYGLTIFGGSPDIYGGGIFIDSNGVLNIYHSVITENEGANGGGIYYQFSTVNIENSVISNNNGGTGGGGIRGFGTVNISNSTLANNTGVFGGAISLSSGTVTINSSTLSGNTAFDPMKGNGYGGAINNFDTLYITNSTISGNSAVTQGGGIRNFGIVQLQNSTLANNTAQTGGGIIALSGVVSTTNSIIANNYSGGDCSGTITSNDYNLDSDNSCNLAQPNDIPDVDPMLGALGNNGGPTWTHALLDGSPAIEEGDCSSGKVTVDQRGIARPQGLACDIGAFEYGGAAFVIAVDDEYFTYEDITLLVPTPGILTNDSSLYAITSALALPPQHGLIDLKLDGSLVYTPSLNYNGLDWFTYIASDGIITDTAIVTITVNAVNDVPVASNDTFTTTEDSPLTVLADGLLYNDGDADGDSLIIVGNTSSLSGTLIVNPNGTFIYTPTLNFNGRDWFTYTVSDGVLTDTATAVITVTAVNDVPTAVGDIYTATTGIMLTVAAPGVLGNDLDVDSELMTATLVTPPVSGTLSLNPDGSFVYLPAPDFAGVVSFVYYASDGHGNSNPVIVTIYVIRESFLLYLPVITRSYP